MSAIECLREAEKCLAAADALVARTYVPHPGQEKFHRSPAVIRAIFSGNRWGKSRCAAQECNAWAAGKKDWFGKKLREPPVRVRVVGDGYEHGIDKILVPIFRRIVDPQDLYGGTWTDGYAKGRHTIKYANGSTIELMSYRVGDLGRGAQMFAGVALDLLWQDEHGPHAVWEENQARIGPRPMYSIITLTPVLGETWEHDFIYSPWQKGAKHIECFTGSMMDNPHIDKKAAESYLAGIADSQMREVRRSGVWIALGGSVYAGWDEARHFIPTSDVRIEAATKTVVIDPHPSKPTAVLWCGVDAGEQLFAYREYRQRKSIPEICDDIRRLSAREDIRRFLIDPHWGWVNVMEKGVAGKSVYEQYRDNGIPVEKASSDKQGRMALMRSLLSVSPTLKRAQFEVMKSCPRLAWEFPHKRFRPQTDAMRERDRMATIDEDDDLLTCAEYFVMSQPRFQGERPSKSKIVIPPTYRIMMQS